MSLSEDYENELDLIYAEAMTAYYNDAITEHIINLASNDTTEIEKDKENENI